MADDGATAQSCGKDDANSPYRFYYSQLFRKLKRSNRHTGFEHDRDEPEETITLDRILDDLVICGTVNEVVDQILALRGVTGDFGELVYAGTDWVDKTLSRRSMQLMAEEVMPRGQ